MYGVSPERMTDETSTELRRVTAIIGSLLLRRCRLRWYGHVTHESDADWVKACSKLVVDDTAPVGRPKKTEEDLSVDTLCVETVKTSITILSGGIRQT